MTDGLHRRVGVVIASVVMAAAVVAEAWAADPPAEPTLVLKRQTFRDPGSNNIESHTVLVPAGWKAEGGAFWAPAQMFRVQPSQRITVTAPDGRQAMISPTLGATDIKPSAFAEQQLGARRPAEGGVDSGLPIIYMPQNVEQWRQWVVKHGITRPYAGATDVACEVVVVEEMTKFMHRQMEPVLRDQERANQQAAALGMATRQWANGVVLAARATYAHEGKRWEQFWLFGTWALGTTEQVGTQVLWSIEPNLSFRAPAGKLTEAMPLLMAIAHSVRMTPQWATMKAKHANKLAQIDAEAFAARTNIIAQSSAELRQITQQTWENQQAASDSAHHQFLQSLHETGEYQLPNSNLTLSLPIHYNHYFTDGESQIVLTNDPNIPEAQGLQVMLPATSGLKGK